MIKDYDEEPDLKYTYIALLSPKINVLIVGGKKSAYIKCKTFSKGGCQVTVVAQEFGEEFKLLREKENMVLIQGSYESAFLENKHLVIIALDNKDTKETIIKQCENSSKLYLTCDDFKEGKFITPFQRHSEAINFGINIKNASPITTRYLGGKILKELQAQDGYVKFVSEVREKLKGKDEKHEVMEFLSSDDFYFFYEIGKGGMIFNLFFGGSEFEL